MLDTPTTSFIYKGFSSPNGTIVPDDVFDVLLPQLTDPELRVLLYIIRKTFGWKKDSDNISLSQMVHGVTARDGRVLDGGAGLSKASAARGIQGLVKKGIIKAIRNVSKQRGNEPTTYQLRFEGEPLSQIETRGGLSQSETTLVSNRDTQQTTIQTTDFDHSNIRKSTRSNDKENGRTISQAITVEAQPSDSESKIYRGVEDIGAILHRERMGELAEDVETATPAKAKRRKSKLKAPNMPPEEYQAVIEIVKDYSRKMGDMDHFNSNVTQAVNLIEASSCDLNSFYMQVIEAHKITSLNTKLEHRMAYFFTVLRDRLLPSAEDGKASLPN